MIAMNFKKFLKVFLIIFTAAGGLLLVLGIVQGIVTDPSLFVMCIPGALFFTVGLIPLLILRKKSKATENLIETGIHVTATVKDVEINQSLSVNGQNPYRLVCEGADPSGETRIYTSGNIMADVYGLVGETVDVYVSKDEPDRYYVDIRKLRGVL